MDSERSSHYAMAITHLMRYDIIGPPSARISQFNGPDEMSIQCVQYVCVLRIDWIGMGGLRSASVRAAPRESRRQSSHRMCAMSSATSGCVLYSVYFVCGSAVQVIRNYNSNVAGVESFCTETARHID